MRNGYTTGTCASAATKASLSMLLNKEIIESVEVTLPSGDTILIELFDQYFDKNKAICSVVKDAGDDPDITNGAKIFAEVSLTNCGKISILGGKGVGTVTKKGLVVPVGKPAINPVPLKMITESAQELLPEGTGCNITISVPKGEELAQKTFNPQLGIIGGISILGTTGIVRPMSEDALKKSLKLKLSVIKEAGHTDAVLVLGNYGEKFVIEQFGKKPDKIAQTSNFIGYMLDTACEYGFDNIFLAGHIGKLIKLAGGIFNTHSKVADARNEIFAAHYMQYTKDAESFFKIMEANTAEEATSMVSDNTFFDYLAETIKGRVEHRCHHKINATIALFSYEEGLLNTVL